MIRLRQGIASLALIAAASALVWAYFSPHADAKNEVRARSRGVSLVEGTPLPAGDDADTIRALRAEVRALSQQVRLLNANTSLRQHVREEESPVSEPEVEEPFELRVAKAKEQSEQRFSEIGAHFESEPRDSDWAFEVEGSITSVISERFPDQVSVRDVRCGSTLCRVVVDPVEDASAEHFKMLFTGLVGSDLPRATSLNRDDGSIEYFLARQGHELPKSR